MYLNINVKNIKDYYNNSSSFFIILKYVIQKNSIDFIMKKREEE